MRYQSENFNGELDFRCREHFGWRIQANIHEYSECLYCRKGSGIVTVNGEVILLREKEFVWLPPNYVHQYDCEEADKKIINIDGGNLVMSDFTAGVISVCGSISCVRFTDND